MDRKRARAASEAWVYRARVTAAGRMMAVAVSLIDMAPHELLASSER